MTKKALSTLFPACTSRSKKRKFDPAEECVVATQQKRKKPVILNIKVAVNL